MSALALLSGILIATGTTPEQEQALADAEALTKEYAQAYASCVRREARELEPSGESAEAIAASALAACREYRTGWVRMLSAVIVVNNRLSADGTAQVVNETVAVVDQELKSQATLIVVQVRRDRAVDK